MKAVAMDTADDSTSQASDEQLVSLQIYVPELVVQKCMQFNREELIWDVKNQILAALPKELKEGFNYGLFCPPVNGRAGKFLDEERPLADYPFSDSSGYVELRYKRRIYKMNMEEKQLRQLHSRANLRRLLDHVHNCHVEKITKMCSRGLDPNFHCSESGESPLTLTTTLKHPAKVIMALVNGGAHLDFRTKDGCTVLHRAVEKNNLEALRTLLDLGSSPNYKDMRGLTPLYYSVLYNSDPQLTEMLLHDHAMIGSADPHGWQEVHQACKYGLVQHLEHLLFYGADMNARNASGNTPLHVCAVNDQESCARVLLFRGADKGALNFANQNPHQVAVIAGNLRLADIIKNHRTEDVELRIVFLPIALEEISCLRKGSSLPNLPYREAPRYNPRRRTSTANMGTLSHNHSDPRLELVLSGKPPSPCPSNHSLPHLSSGSGSEVIHTGEEDAEDSTPAGATTALNTDPTESSGAGANSSGTDSDPFDSAKSTPLLESVCVCIEEYTPSTSGHLQLSKGDLVEVIGVSGSGYLEGRRRDGDEGLFPATCVQEMPLRGADTLPASGRFRTEGRRNVNAKGAEVPRKWRMFGEPRTVILHKGKKGFGFVLRGAKDSLSRALLATSPLMERQPTEFWPSLQYLDDVDKGGVAEMAGLKKGDFLLEINGQDVSQASHEHVVAIIRQSGDLVSMTVVTVLQQPPSVTPTDKPQLINRQCATLPRKLSTKKAPLPPKRDPKTTLSVGRARARSMVAGLAEIEVLDHTLNEYDSEGRSTKSSSIESIPNKPGSSATPESTPSTTTTTPTTTTTTTPTSSQTPASMRSRPSSRRVSISELEDFFARHLSSTEHVHGSIRNKFATIARIHRFHRRSGSNGKRSRTSSVHSTKDDLDFRLPKNYSSTQELTLDSPGYPEFDVPNALLLRRSRSLGDVHVLHLRHSWACPPQGYNKAPVSHPPPKDQPRQHRHQPPLLRQHSVPETSRTSGNDNHKFRERQRSPEMTAPTVIKQNGSDIYAETIPVMVKPSDKPTLPGRASCPPPSYPPPPPPVGQVVKVDVSRALGEYANLTVGRQHKHAAIMSSFRPTDSAKLYASPDAFMAVGYKKDHLQKCDVTLPRHLMKGAGLRSHSLPPKMPPGTKTGSGAVPGRSTASLDADHSSGDSATGYAPFKTQHRSRDQSVSESGHQPDRGGTLRKVKTGGAAYGVKFQASSGETASPKHYPPLATHSHEPFIPEPDYDSSEDEDRSSALDSKGGLVTFKALDNQQNGANDVGKEQQELSPPKQQPTPPINVGAEVHQNNSSREKAKVDETLVPNHIPYENGSMGDKMAPVHSQEAQVTTKFETTNEMLMLDSEVVLSEETGERIFVRSEKVSYAANADPSALTSEVPDSRNGSNPELKVHKIAPVPPPKKTDEVSSSKLAESSNDKKPCEAKSEALPVKEILSKTNRDVIEKQLKESVRSKESSPKDRSEALSKASIRESLPFKATIILKQTEIVSKETPFRTRNKELTPQHSAHDLIQSLETSIKGKGDETPHRDVKEITQKEGQVKEKSVRSPSQTFKESMIRELNSKDKTEMSPQKSVKEMPAPPEAVSSKDKIESNAQKVAPAVPKKPKVEEVKTSEEAVEIVDSAKMLQVDGDGQEKDATSPGVEVVTRSVRENIYNFEKRSELAAKTTFSPRRKSDVIRITLIGSQHKTTDNKPEEKAVVQTMKTSKSCPKTFEEDEENGGGASSDMESQIGRLSAAETPTSAPPMNAFASEEWKRPDILSPPLAASASAATQLAAESAAKKPPDTPPKSTIMRRLENYNKQSTLGRKTASSIRETENGELESLPFSGAMTLNRQSLAKSGPLHASLPSAGDSRRTNMEHMLVNSIRSKDVPESSPPQAPQPTKAPPLSAQARLLENRPVRVPPPVSKAPIPKTNEDDECLRLCQRVDKSLQLIRLQVDSLGMAAVSEPEVLAELVPPPPEFNITAHHPIHNVQAPPPVPLHIAPPPEFSDESLARHRRHHPPNVIPTRMVIPSTMDAPVSRRTVPPDIANYTYIEHQYRGYVQSPDSHPHPIPNNMSSSPIKTMTISRGYTSAHHMHQPIRHESNCNTLPHPPRMSAPQIRQEHPFSPGRTTRDTPRMMGPPPPAQQLKEFRQKPLHQWNGRDVSDWLESLFLPEYKPCFAEAGITGAKLANMDNNDLMGLGVKQAGHRLNMERSIKWYLK